MMDSNEILSAVENELANCENSDALVYRKQTAIDYYQGAEPKPPEIKGRSGVVSTDCADAVEWILPSIVESLSGKAVKFRPCSAQDEAQAELETDYTHFLWSEDNNGYLNLYEASKDALLTGVGILKIWYDDTPERVVENYSGLQEPQLEALLADPMLEVTEIERSATDGITVTAARITRQGRVRVECVPAEEFRVCDDHDSIDLSDARFVAHSRRRTASELLAEGYDPDLIDEASDSDLDRDTADYHYISPEVDTSQKLIVVTEAYMRIDINEDGIAELCKVTVLGERTPSEILDIEEISEIPFVAMAAIPNPHSFYGISIFDRLKQVQDLKTAILRSTLDSFYQNVNKQKVVQEGQVNLDDLLVTRPGGIIRAKGHNAVMEIGGTPMGPEAFQLLQYADEQKRSRVGVSADMAGQNQLVNNESAHAVERLMSAQEMLTGLIVRSIAETGIRPAYRMMRDLMVRFHNATVPFKFRGKWQNINPADWGERSRMMVTVGAGASDENQKMAALQQIYQIQTQLSQGDPSQAMVTPKQMFATLNDFINLNGLGDSEQYFLNPESPEGMQVAQQKQQQMQQKQQQDMQMQQMQLQMQQTTVQAQAQVAQAEMAKAQAQAQNNQMKAQIDAIKVQHQTELENMKNQIAMAKEMGQQRFNVQKLQTDAALKLTEMELSAKKDLNKEVADNQGVVNGSGPAKGSKKGSAGKS